MKHLLFTLFLLASQTVFAQTNSHFKKVVWIVFENTNYSKALAQPYFNKLSKQGALFTNLMAEDHPSQGNYIAMIAGSKLNVKNDNVVDLKESHVGDLLEKAGMRWKVYAESYPGNCFTGKQSGSYVRKHVPFMSFVNVNQNSARCLNIEDETKFGEDFNNGTLAEYSMYIPNLRSDGHDTGVDFAGKWFEKTLGNIFLDSAKLSDTLFVITFDESGASIKNQIFTVLLGAKIKPGVQNSQLLNHTALLKMIEDEFGLGNLGREDMSAPVINGIWQ